MYDISNIYILLPQCQLIWKSNKKKGIEIEAIYENSFRINQIVINDDDDLYEAKNNIIAVSVYALALYYLFSIVYLIH